MRVFRNRHQHVLARPQPRPLSRPVWGFEALVRIDTLDVIRGSLPKRAVVLVLEWASEHRVELNEDWELCRALATPKPISPLE